MNEGLNFDGLLHVRLQIIQLARLANDSWVSPQSQRITKLEKVLVVTSEGGVIFQEPHYSILDIGHQYHTMQPPNTTAVYLIGVSVTALPIGENQNER